MQLGLTGSGYGVSPDFKPFELNATGPRNSLRLLLNVHHEEYCRKLKKAPKKEKKQKIEKSIKKRKKTQKIEKTSKKEKNRKWGGKRNK